MEFELLSVAYIVLITSSRPLEAAALVTRWQPGRGRGRGRWRGATCGVGRRLLATWCLDIADLFYQICWVLCYKSPNGCKRVVFRDYVDHYRDSRLHCNRFVTTATLNKRTIPFPWYWCCRSRSSWWQYHTLQSCPVMGSFGEMRSINLMRTTRWIFLWRYFTFFTPTTSKAVDDVDHNLICISHKSSSVTRGFLGCFQIYCIQIFRAAKQTAALPPGIRN